MRQALDQFRGVLEQHVVAEVILFGRHDDPRGARERSVEAPHPFVAADGDARAHEIVALERQHDVHFGVARKRRFDEQQVGAAGCGREDDRLMQACEMAVERRAHRGNERRSESVATSRACVSIMWPANATTSGTRSSGSIRPASGIAGASSRSCRRIVAIDAGVAGGERAGGGVAVARRRRNRRAAIALPPSVATSQVRRGGTSCKAGR